MKRKKASTPHAELNFVSSLELEQSVDIIAVLADTYPVTLTERNTDRIDFDIKFRHGTVSGILQRWRGNETRIMCQGDVVRVVMTDNTDYNVHPSVIIASSFICIALFGAGQVIPAMLGAGTLFALGSRQDWNIKKSEHNTVPIFRERDAIFQFLIDRFKASGEVSLM